MNDSISQAPSDRAGQESARSTLARALAVFDLFETNKLEWPLEEISKELGLSASTTYRYLKTLCEVGFLAVGPQGLYTIGPRVSLLEFLLRNTDPLVKIAEPYALDLIREFRGAALVNKAFREGLVCIYRSQAESDPRELFSRGHSMHKIRGAHAMISQAYLSRHRLVKLYRENSEEFAQIGIASSEALSAVLRRVRKERIAFDRGNFRTDSLAIAAPLLDSKGKLLGAFSFTAPIDGLSDLHIIALRKRVALAAQDISNRWG